MNLKNIYCFKTFSQLISIIGGLHIVITSLLINIFICLWEGHRFYFVSSPSVARCGLFLATWLELTLRGGWNLVAYKPPKCGLFGWKNWLILAYLFRHVWCSKLAKFVLKIEIFGLRQHIFTPNSLKWLIKTCNFCLEQQLTLVNSNFGKVFL